tara:strand:- start:25 stop:408 length:384 start_codon:yes stop_codon:yes gene_type:complete
MSEPNYNHNVRVVTLVTGERVLCLFGAVRDEEDGKINAYRLIYPYILTLGKPNEDGTMPINYTRFNPFSPFEEHIVAGEHIISVVLPDDQIFQNFREKLVEAGLKDDQIFYPEESNGDNSKPAEAAE